MTFGFINPQGTVAVVLPNAAPARGISYYTNSTGNTSPIPNATKPALTATIVADITVEEQHHDELKITHHPVQQGAMIADHAYKAPAELTLHLGWSNSTASAQGLLGTLTNASGAATASISNLLASSSYVNQAYESLLRLQSAATLLTVITAKRVYKNMLIATLSTSTDKKTANALMITVHLQEIILVNTSTSVVPLNQVQAAPQSTGNTQPLGTQLLQPLAAATTFTPTYGLNYSGSLYGGPGT